MKNVRETQLKKCIFFLFDEFEYVLKKLGITPYLGRYQISYSKMIDNDEEQVEDIDVCAALSEYFDVNVTSIHVDQLDRTGVWIAYEGDKK